MHWTAHASKADENGRDTPVSDTSKECIIPSSSRDNITTSPLNDMPVYDQPKVVRSPKLPKSVRLSALSEYDQKKLFCRTKAEVVLGRLDWKTITQTAKQSATNIVGGVVVKNEPVVSHIGKRFFCAVLYCKRPTNLLGFVYIVVMFCEIKPTHCVT